MRDAPPPPSSPAAVEPRRAVTVYRMPHRRRIAVWIGAAALLALIGLGLWWGLGSGGTPAAGKRGFDPANRVTPVSAVPVRTADLPVRLAALGTVTARSTVTVRSRVDGQLMRVYFQEGDTVKAGQLLAQIDPRSFEVGLAQAQAQLARDQAQADAARADLARYRGLLASDSIARQQVETQEALVRQLEGTVAADRAAVDSARLQLSYTRITAPVSGVIGLRQVDPGNMVHTSDANGIVIVTEVQPVSVIFSLPQDNLQAVLARTQQGAELAVDAYDREGRTRLASGTLITVDNVVDVTTGTVKLKAQFPNTDRALFPNQFVNVRLLVETQANALVVPTSSIQRGAPGTYVYVVRDDATVTVRPVKLGPAAGELTSITGGLTAGERVVADGADKLREGAKVELIDPSAAPANAPGSGTVRSGGERGKGKGRRDGSGGRTPSGAAETPASPTSPTSPAAPAAPGSPASNPPPGKPERQPAPAGSSAPSS